MTALNLVPILSGVTASPTPVEVPSTMVPEGFEHFVDVRVTNLSAETVFYTLALGQTADHAAAGYRTFDVEVPAKSSLDVEVGLFLTFPFRFFHRASAASALHVWFTGTKRQAS